MSELLPGVRDTTPDPRDMELLVYDSNLKRKLARIIEDHLPRFAVPLMSPEGRPHPDENDSGVAAFLLQFADLTAAEKFGASKEAQLLREMDRLARHLAYNYLRLSPMTRAKLDQRYQEASQDEKQSMGDAVCGVMDAIYNLCQERPFQALPSKKRNWRAASVADECRRVWAIGHWEEPFPSEETSPEDRVRYQAHLRDFAPKWDKHDFPGPFGRFLRDVLEEIGVVGANGEPVSAATALASWRAALEQPIESR